MRPDSPYRHLPVDEGDRRRGKLSMLPCELGIDAVRAVCASCGLMTNDILCSHCCCGCGLAPSCPCPHAVAIVQARYQSRNAEERPTVGSCRGCGEAYVPVRSNHFYCSRSCAKKSKYRSKMRSYPDGRRVVQAIGIPAACQECGGHFIKLHLNKKYCSDRCSKDYKNRRARARWQENKE